MRMIIIAVLLLLSMGSLSWSQEKTKETAEEQANYPNRVLFEQIRKYWEKQEYHHLQSLLGKRVTINLGKYRGHYPTDQAIGILKAYFAEIEEIKLRYEVKKMQESRGVATYQFRIKETGVLHKKVLYFYLQKDTADSQRWVLTHINEI